LPYFAFHVMTFLFWVIKNGSFAPGVSVMVGTQRSKASPFTSYTNPMQKTRMGNNIEL